MLYDDGKFADTYLRESVLGAVLPFK